MHPPEMKELAEDKPIRTAKIPKTLSVPVVQHIGAPCSVTVETGQSVSEGQIIAQTQAFVTAPVHAPVSGKVKKIDLSDSVYDKIIVKLRPKIEE